MAKLARIFQKIFGSTASAGRIGVFGSLNAGSPATTTNPATMQSLTNWLQGWDGSILGNNSPPLEDMNAAFYVAHYQLAYLMQQGIPEWNSSTSYYIGSLAQDSYGNIFTSIIDDNLNYALTDSTKWAKFSTRLNLVETSTTPFNVTIFNDVISIDASGGSKTVNLPLGSTSEGKVLKIRKSDSSENGVNIIPNGSDTIDGISSKIIYDQFATIILLGKSGGWITL